MIDALGGVDIAVDRAMNYDDRRGNVHIHFQPGTYHMDGEQALEYARFRHDATGDWGRIQRQQHLILSLFDQAIRPGNWGKLQRAAQAFLQNITVTVNPDSPRQAPQIGLDQVLSMIGFLSQLDTSRMRFYEVPCVDIWWRDRACLKPVYEDTRRVLSEVFRDDAAPGWETLDQGVPRGLQSTSPVESGLAGTGQGE
jgi:hypothetical protein